jgi:hypothetical protein
VGRFAGLAVDTEQMAAQLQLPVEKLNPDGEVALLAEIVRDLPSLPGAACVDQYRLYDELPWRGPEHHDQQRERVKRAAACCAACPVQAKCPTVVISGATSITAAVGVRRASAVRQSTPADLRAS